MKKFFNFLVCATYIFSTGGIAYLFYDKHILFGVVSTLTFIMAFPYVKQNFKNLLRYDK